MIGDMGIDCIRLGDKGRGGALVRLCVCGIP